MTRIYLLINDRFIFILFFKKYFNYFILCSCLTCMYVCAICVSLVTMEARRGCRSPRIVIIVNCGCWKSKPFSCWAVSLAPVFVFILADCSFCTLLIALICFFSFAVIKCPDWGKSRNGGFILTDSPSYHLSQWRSQGGRRLFL